MLELIPSRYNVLVSLTGGRALAFNAAHGGLAIWSAQERSYYDRVVAGDPGVRLDHSIADDMVTGGYLVRRSTDELAIIEEQHAASRSDPRGLSLMIAPTLACNFGCDYCFEGRHKPSDTMSPAVQDAIVALIGSAAPDVRRLFVSWYGGEPLTRKSLIRELSDRMLGACAERGIEYSAQVITNGYLLDAPTARWLHERRVRTIQITLDGSQASHDRRRHLLGGQGTFGRIVENLRAVVEAVPELGLSIRVNIDDRNRDDIHALLDHLARLGLGGRPNLKVYFAPVEASSEGCQGVREVCMKKAAYADLETDLYRHAYDEGLSNLPYPPRFSGNCMAVSPRSYVIAPSGDLHKCMETINDSAQAVGSLFDMAAVPSSPLAQRWHGWTPFDYESCRSCRLLPSCAGSCAHKFFRTTGRDEAAILPCPSWKYEIKERLLLRAEKMGAIGSDDYEPEATRTDPDELCADVLAGGAGLRTPHLPARAAHEGQGARRLPILS